MTTPKRLTLSFVPLTRSMRRREAHAILRARARRQKRRMAEISAPDARQRLSGLDALVKRYISDTHALERDSFQLDTRLVGERLPPCGNDLLPMCMRERRQSGGELGKNNSHSTSSHLVGASGVGDAHSEGLVKSAVCSFSQLPVRPCNNDVARLLQLENIDRGGAGLSKASSLPCIGPEARKDSLSWKVDSNRSSCRVQN